MKTLTSLQMWLRASLKHIIDEVSFTEHCLLISTHFCFLFFIFYFFIFLFFYFFIFSYSARNVLLWATISSIYNDYMARRDSTGVTIVRAPTLHIDYLL
jgi:hypothetical protein